MILVEVTINTVLNRLSMEGIALTHWWDNKVISFDPPVYKTSEKRGGFCSLSFGSVSFSPDLFESDWPPPINCVTTVYYTETTEAAKQKMFEGTLHLNDIKNDEITYEFYGETVDFDLLDESYAYDEDAVDVVKAATYKWTVIGATSEYYCELLAGGDPEIVEPEIIFEDDTAITEGSAVGSLAINEWIYDDPGTGWDTVIVRIAGSVDPDTKADGYLRAGYTDEQVPYYRAFGEVTHVKPLRLANAWGGNYRYDMGHITGTVANCGEAVGDIWCVYDDGVDISSNVTNVLNNVFELTSAPVGTVTMSGTGEDITITEIFDWAATRISYTLDSTYVASPAPSISYWANKQKPLTDFLGKLTEFFSHLFYLRDSKIYLVSMSADNGSASLDSYDFMVNQLEYTAPISQITAEWETRKPGEWSEADNPGVAAGVYVKETTETVTIDGGYSYGDELSISDIFAYTRSDVTDALTDILALEQEPDVEVTMPFTGTLPLPGKKITIIDDTMKVNSTIIMHVGEVHYDMSNNEIKLIGNGSITTT